MYLDLSVARLFPGVYTLESVSGLVLTGYGTRLQGSAAGADIPYDRVYMVEDADELDVIVGWKVRPDKIVGFDTQLHTAVNVYFTSPYVLPLDDMVDAGIPLMYEPLINLGALIEALEARQDTGVRGEPMPTGTFFETQLLDRLRPRYDALKQELSKALPGMAL